MPRWALPRDGEPAEESSEEEESEAEDAAEVSDAEPEDEEPDEAPAEAEQPAAEAAPSSAKKKTFKLQKPSERGTAGTGKELGCHVCGRKGHNAGFVGALYVDCPNRPCYLCKEPGHTTATCPHRYTGADLDADAASGAGLLAGIRSREMGGRPQEHPHHKLRWHVDAAVLKLHSRRCTCLEFHPHKDHLVLSGDKKGQVAIWDWVKVHERTVYKPHRALTNNIRFLAENNGNTAVTAGTDGQLKRFDCETGLDSNLINLNPRGWVEGESNERNWNMLYGLDVCLSRNLVIAGDTRGAMHFCDPRDGGSPGAVLAHKKGNKVNTIHCNPQDANLVASASNDWHVRIFDLRCMPTGGSAASPSAPGRGKQGKGHPEGFELGSLPHPKVVNSAYFSPSGTKLLTTCIDNRLRVWDSWASGASEPSRQMVHSHDFNRYLTPVRAEWDPKDSYERLVVAGRYISEVYGGLALHPVDLVDMGTGRQLAALTDPNLTTISPVNKPHPRQDVIISGSSRSLYAWRPMPDDDGAASRQAAASLDQKPIGSANFLSFDCMADDDDDDEDGGKKKKRAKKSGTEEQPSKSKKKKG